MARNDLEGFEELERAIRRLGRVPKKVVTKAARAGAKIVLKSARVNAPKLSGALKRGIVMRVERQKRQGQRVFDVIIDPKMEDVFVKRVDNPSPNNRGTDPTRAYYPASQEYGFLTVNGRLVEGKRYLQKAADVNKDAVESEIIDVGIKEIDKAWEAR